MERIITIAPNMPHDRTLATLSGSDHMLEPSQAERVAELAGATGGTCGDPLAARLESVLADIRDTFELSPPISTCSMLMVADPALRQLLGGADVPIVAELVEDSTGCTEVCREHDTACRDATSLLTAMAEDWQELTELAEARNCEL